MTDPSISEFDTSQDNEDHEVLGDIYIPPEHQEKLLSVAKAKDVPTIKIEPKLRLDEWKACDNPRNPSYSVSIILRWHEFTPEQEQKKAFDFLDSVFDMPMSDASYHETSLYVYLYPERYEGDDS